MHFKLLCDDPHPVQSRRARDSAIRAQWGGRQLRSQIGRYVVLFRVLRVVVVVRARFDFVVALHQVERIAVSSCYKTARDCEVHVVMSDAIEEKEAEDNEEHGEAMV